MARKKEKNFSTKQLNLKPKKLNEKVKDDPNRGTVSKTRWPYRKPKKVSEKVKDDPNQGDEKKGIRTWPALVGRIWNDISSSTKKWFLCLVMIVLMFFTFDYVSAVVCQRTGRTGYLCDKFGSEMVWP